MQAESTTEISKSFDLSGTHDDDMLRLYLRKAGLCDDLSRYPAVQRRAYVVDIIKSNKLPGYWVPTSMRGNVTPPMVRPPPLTQRMPSTTSFSADTTPTNSAAHSPHMPLRFARTQDPTPLDYISIGRKTASRREISDPINFQHLSGDMTRDMTRKAFDLRSDANDNVLRKYMFERGISDTDIAGYSKEYLIRKIVQSKFSWVPEKIEGSNLQLQYAKINTHSEITPPSSPQPSEYSVEYESDYATLAGDRSPTALDPAQSRFNNFSLISARFADPSLFPTPKEIFQKIETPKAKSKDASTNNVKRSPPPPPPIARIPVKSNISRPLQQDDLANTYEIIAVQAQTLQKPAPDKFYTFSTKSSRLPPPPPPPSLAKIPGQKTSVISKTLPTKRMSRRSIKDTFMPAQPLANHSKSNNKNNSSIPPPPPPPPPPPQPTISQSVGRQTKASLSTSTATDNANTSQVQNKTTPIGNDQNTDSHDALMQSICKGVALKKVDASASGTEKRTLPISNNKPKANDLLSELKLTLRRVRDHEGTASDEEFDESHA